MSNIFNIARWEWFKAQRRKMPWILLAIFFVFTQLAVWGTFVAYSTMIRSGGRVAAPFTPGMGRPTMVRCNDLIADPAGAVPAGTSQQNINAMLQQCQIRMIAAATQYRTLTPAGSISRALGTASSLGLILLAILSASMVGMEYGVGTLRPILVRGTGRMRYLAGKYLMLIGATTGALLVICGAAAASGLLTAHLVGAPPGNAPSATAFGDVAISFVKTWSAMITYVIMASSITLLTRSTAAGMAISLAYYVAEGILVRLLSVVFDSFDKIADYLPMRNINALAGGSDGLAAMLGGGNKIGTTHASLVLATCVILFAGVAALVFRNRDIGGAAGG